LEFIFIIFAIIAAIVSIVNKAGQVSTSQQKQEYERQLQQYQRQQGARGYNQTGQRSPYRTTGQRPQHPTAQVKADKTGPRHDVARSEASPLEGSDSYAAILKSEPQVEALDKEPKLKLDLSNESLLNSIILAEILAPPKARRKHP